MKTDAFSKCHPAVNFIFFMGAIISTVLIQHPAYLAAGLVCSGTYYLLLKGAGGWKLMAGLIPLYILVTAINPLFNTYGETVLLTFFGRPYTLEALLYGGAIAAVFVETILWFGCYNVVLTSDKFTSLFGNLIPALSLLLVMVLRLIPSFLRKARQITGARSSIGKGGTGQDSQKEKLMSGLVVLGALTSWALEGSLVTADSMKSRGYGCGKRSSFMLYTMTGRDGILIACEAVFMVLMIIFGNRTATYTPDFYIAPVAGLGLVLGLCFYTGYLFIPIALFIKEAVQWHISISGI